MPRSKDRALSLQTLTHFSINSSLNTNHTWNKPLTTEPSPRPPKSGVTHLPPSPSPPSLGCPWLQGEQAVRNLRPGSRHWLSTCTLIREPTQPPSSPAAEVHLSARDLVKATGQGPVICLANFPGGFSLFQLLHGRTASATGRESFGFAILQLRPVLHCPSL